MVVSYGSVLSPLRQSLTQDDLRAHCAVFFMSYYMILFYVCVFLTFLCSVCVSDVLCMCV